MWLRRFLGKAGTITFSYPKGLGVGRGGGGVGVGGILKGSLSWGVGRLGGREKGRGLGREVFSLSKPSTRKRHLIQGFLRELVYLNYCQKLIVLWLSTRVAWVRVLWRTGPWDCFGGTNFAPVSRSFQNSLIALYQIKIQYWPSSFLGVLLLWTETKLTPTYIKAKEKERKRPVYSNLDPNKLDQTRVYHVIWPTKTTESL